MSLVLLGCGTYLGYYQGSRTLHNGGSGRDLNIKANEGDRKNDSATGPTSHTLTVSPEQLSDLLQAALRPRPYPGTPTETPPQSTAVPANPNGRTAERATPPTAPTTPYCTSVGVTPGAVASEPTSTTDSPTTEATSPCNSTHGATPRNASQMETYLDLQMAMLERLDDIVYSLYGHAAATGAPSTAGANVAHPKYDPAYSPTTAPPPLRQAESDVPPPLSAADEAKLQELLQQRNQRRQYERFTKWSKESR